MRRALAALAALPPLASAELRYQHATAPPPLAAACEPWCPRATCCATCAAAACAGCGLTRDCSSAHADATPPPPPLATAGRAPLGFQTGEDGQLYANGRRFLVKGVNWWGLEGPGRAPGGLGARGMDELMDFLAEQRFNAMRTLVNHHAVLVNGKLAADAFDEGRNPELINLRYLEVLDKWIEEAAKREILVMVNVHRTMPTAWPGEGLWYDSHVSEREAIDSWRALARSLCKHWNAFAADLVNEPVKAAWGRGGANDWNKAAERIGNAVLDECPRLLIFVQGVGGNPGAPGDGGEAQGYFWGENLVGVKAAPVRLRDMSKLVYSPHTYGPGVFPGQPYFPTCTGGGCVRQNPPFPANMPAIWDRHFGVVAAESKHALVIGEAFTLSTFYYTTRRCTPPPPPSPLPSPPPPLFADELLALFAASPPPPPPSRLAFSPPPPPPWFPVRHIGVTRASSASPPPPAVIRGRPHAPPDAASASAWISAALLAAALLAAAFVRYRYPSPSSPSSPSPFSASASAFPSSRGGRPPLPKPRRRGAPEEEHSLTAADDSSSNDVEAADDAPLAVGARVRLHSLRSAAHQNGKQGVLMGRHDGDGARLKVRLDSGEILALRPANVAVCQPPPQLAAMVAALERAGEHQKAALLRECIDKR
ncbi:hypothetical protein AB1Y20_014107 [Prymnesium parvum]|uniref:Glycoside hydrolase family 5 domain-containing protein n=1 Tax=Prymnesium parvum TaxID=97485 RepID=A0AB34IHK5_PRYPA